MPFKQRIFTEEFKREAVHLALTSGRKRDEIAADLGVGKSSLSRWVSLYRHQEHSPAISDTKDQELARLRKENQILKAERDLLKKATAFFAKESR